MRTEEEGVSYKPITSDPLDVKLGSYINRAPLGLRSKMNFQRESEGVYRYQRKRVFMKIEGESIVIRVGGGYLTMDEFVQIYCYGQEDATKAKLASMMHETQEEKKFKTFYVTSHSANKNKFGGATPQVDKSETSTSPVKPRFFCNGSPSK